MPFYKATAIRDVTLEYEFVFEAEDDDHAHSDEVREVLDAYIGDTGSCDWDECYDSDDAYIDSIREVSEQSYGVSNICEELRFVRPLEEGEVRPEPVDPRQLKLFGKEV